MVQKNNINKLIIICGPTCTGKSDLAAKAAYKLGGAVISADSMQIYRRMDIGTAKIRPEDYPGIAHYMLDIVEPQENFSVAEYKLQAEEIIDKLQVEGKSAIVAGGTGLYINSLIYPLSFGDKDGDSKLRDKLNAELSLKGALFLHDKLRGIDPESADRIHPNNTRRVIRALEIAESGSNMSARKDNLEPIRDFMMVGLQMPREKLYGLINTRVDGMFNQGLIEEVERLKMECSFDCQSMQAIGYKEFKGYFEGTADIDSVKDKIKQNTRNYAKRQMTWFKRYNNIRWFDALSEREEALRYIEDNI
jgi:tRNA dimethylallyltransferase